MLYFSGVMDPPACVWCCGRELQCEVPTEERGGGYSTVYSPSTSVTLQDIVPNTEYNVSVAAINSAGEMSVYTETVQFELQGDLWLFKCCGSQ